jgi:hypothetical protein
MTTKRRRRITARRRLLPILITEDCRSFESSALNERLDNHEINEHEIN